VHRLHTFAATAIITMAAVFSAACASSAGRQHSSIPHSSDVVTWSELATEAHQNAYVAVERLRPLFFHVRPGAGDARGEPRTISVFIDGDFAGGLDVLRSIPVRDIESIRRVQPSMAYATLGSLHMADEILMVRLRCRVAC
jgi:hypothetical protein